MIIGTIQDIEKFNTLSNNFKTAINYIQATDMLALNQGKHFIDGDEVFIIRDRYVAKTMEECFFESHLNYADIQIVLSGEEGFGYIDATSEGVVITDPYQAEKDMTKYFATPEIIYTLKKDRFAIVFPEDLHMPKIMHNSVEVEKVVIKVKLR
ncbi:MAG: YhcH/YjgK/YiaL family protein [Firmicutes bacterium HGW-Firmicutes-1]|jgi:YhcH/YjgK/YiaL family protein|nr:MAG: YhcH/YjgK/YiaL family protein [Firmicutes bacterium HGW-Firmicutes-1]